MKQGSPDAITIKTSTDGQTWSENAYVFGSSITLANVGDKVYFKQVGGTGTFNSNLDSYYKFSVNGQLECHGNVVSLVDETLQKKTIDHQLQFGMLFSQCVGLETAPILPATTLVSSCYNRMFYGCTNLSSIEVNFSAWNPTNATSNWVINTGSEVTGEKTFICPAALPQTRGTNNIPNGWTIITK